MAEARVQRRLAAILAADVAGYSRLMGIDEEGTLEALKAHRRELIDPLIATHQGRIVKTTGDGMLIEFPSVVDAVRCAVVVQQGMESRDANLPEDRRIRLRIGINVGDVIVDEGDIFGDGVNVAARLEALAEPGTICVSASVKEQVGEKLPVSFVDLGAHAVKNIARPVHVYRVETRASPGDAERPALALPDKPSIAVLPFQNMSGDAEQEYFADGVTEDIITDLSKVSGIFVIGRQSSFVYKGKSVGLRQVGSELGVRYVLEGSVRKAGNRVRITAQLIESRTDSHVWAERYDRDLEDIFAVQEEVARKVVDALAVTLLPEEGARLAHTPTQNIEAYDSFVRARMAVHPPTKDNLARARRLFEQTIALDPKFAGGYAGLSYIGSLSLVHGLVDRSPELIKQVTELAQKAIEMDEALGWSFTALAWAKWIGGNHDEAIAVARRGVSLQPGDAETHNYLGVIMTFGGMASEAIPHIERAIRLNPRSPGVSINFFGYANAMAGNSETAIKTFNQIVPGAYSIYTYAMLILAYIENNDTQKAKQTAQFALENYPHMTASKCTLLFKKHDDIERISRALRVAGIPD